MPRRSTSTNSGTGNVRVGKVFWSLVIFSLATYIFVMAFSQQIHGSGSLSTILFYLVAFLLVWIAKITKEKGLGKR